MIQSFRHKGLRRFYESGSQAGIQPHHAKRLRMQLVALDTAQIIDDMNIAGFRSRNTELRVTSTQCVSGIMRGIV
jgi:toxin HigB-1